MHASAFGDMMHIPQTEAEAVDIFTSPAWSELGLWAPNDLMWDSGAEFVPQTVFSKKMFRLSRKVGASDRSVVYEIEEFPEWVAKYHSYCPHWEEPQDNALREVFFQKLVHSYFPEITPEVKYLSRAYIPETVSDVKMPNSKKSTMCPNSGVRVQVRLVIMGRAGCDLVSIDKIDFLDAIVIGIQIFENLEKLQNINVVHGDIHSGNVAFADDESDQIVLIDFGRASIRPQRDSRIDADTAVHCHPIYSPWEAVGSTGLRTFRDDAYRVLLVLAVMMYGNIHYAFQDRVWCKEPSPQKLAEFMRFKTEANIFDFSFEYYKFTLKSVLPDGLKPRAEFIRDELFAILSYVRNVQFDEYVEYNKIITHLQSIISIDSGQTTTTV